MSQSLPKNLIDIQLSDLDIYQKYELSKLLSVNHKFFQTYFNNLPYSKTQIDCFNKLNDLHIDIFGTEKYSSYNSFRQKRNAYLENRRSNKK